MLKEKSIDLVLGQKNCEIALDPTDNSQYNFGFLFFFLTVLLKSRCHHEVGAAFYHLKQQQIVNSTFC